MDLSRLKDSFPDDPELQEIVKQFDPANFVATAEQVAHMHTALKIGVEGVVAGGTDGISPAIGLIVRPMIGEVENWVMLMDTGFNSALEKARSMKVAAAHVFDKQRIPLGVGMVSEAWMSHQSGEDRKFLLPQDDPERLEIAMVATVNMGPGLVPTEGQMSRRIIQRLAEEQIAWDGDWLDMPHRDESGKITIECNLLGKFFQAYAAFAMKHEDHQAYLVGTQVFDPRKPNRD